MSVAVAPGYTAAVGYDRDSLARLCGHRGAAMSHCSAAMPNRRELLQIAGLFHRFAVKSLDSSSLSAEQSYEALNRFPSSSSFSSSGSPTGGRDRQSQSSDDGGIRLGAGRKIRLCSVRTATNSVGRVARRWWRRRVSRRRSFSEPSGFPWHETSIPNGPISLPPSSGICGPCRRIPPNTDRSLQLRRSIV